MIAVVGPPDSSSGAAKDLGRLDQRRYEHAARSLDETGRLIGGWRNAHEAARD